MFLPRRRLRASTGKPVPQKVPVGSMRCPFRKYELSSQAAGLMRRLDRQERRSLSGMFVTIGRTRRRACHAMQVQCGTSLTLAYTPCNQLLRLLRACGFLSDRIAPKSGRFAGHAATRPPISIPESNCSIAGPNNPGRGPGVVVGECCDAACNSLIRKA